MFNIKNVNISVDDMKYSKTEIIGKDFKLDPSLTREIGKIDENKYFTKLMLEFSNTDDNPFPMDLYIEIKAVFELENISKNDNIEDFLKKPGVHILYPYLRSAVTNITTTALVPAIVLPVVNSFNLFNDNEEKDTD